MGNVCEFMEILGEVELLGRVCMKTKKIDTIMIQELISVKPYYLDGECPEFMSGARVIEYAQNIWSANENDGDFPDSLQSDFEYSLDEAVKVIAWIGETIFKIEV